MFGLGNLLSLDLRSCGETLVLKACVAQAPQDRVGRLIATLKVAMKVANSTRG